ncbi:hypothetical protein OTU49_014035, partial [Cherax quadricarinatus]
MSTKNKRSSSSPVRCPQRTRGLQVPQFDVHKEQEIFKFFSSMSTKNKRSSSSPLRVIRKHQEPNFKFNVYNKEHIFDVFSSKAAINQRPSTSSVRSPQSTRGLRLLQLRSNLQPQRPNFKSGLLSNTLHYF